MRLAVVLLHLLCAIYAYAKVPPKISLKVVEVAVVCDLECNSVFIEHGRNIEDYVKNLFRHIQWRFETDVPALRISFRVTSIAVLATEIPQTYLNHQSNTTCGNSNQGYCPNILIYFSHWMYKNKNIFPEFDLALLLTGHNAMPLAMHSSVCKVNDEEELVGSIVQPLSASNLAISAPSQFAYAIGAGRNFTSRMCTFFGPSCEFDLLFNVSTFTTGINFRKPWRRIADDMVDFVSSENASCLDRTNWNDNPILDTTTVPFKSKTDITMEQQCEVFKRTDKEDSMVEVVHEGCTSIGCKEDSADPTSLIINVIPLDGTKCPKNGRCFRGECIHSHGIQIMSASTGQCVTIESSTGRAKVADCPVYRTFLNTFSLHKIAKSFLISAYLTGSGASRQCWTVRHGKLTLDVCESKKGSLQWKLVETNNQGEYVLFNTYSDQCLLASLSVTSNCTSNQDAVWRLYNDRGLLQKTPVVQEGEAEDNSEHTNAASSGHQLVPIGRCRSFEKCPLRVKHASSAIAFAAAIYAIISFYYVI